MKGLLAFLILAAIGIGILVYLDRMQPVEAPTPAQPAQTGNTGGSLSVGPLNAPAGHQTSGYNSANTGQQNQHRSRRSSGVPSNIQAAAKQASVKVASFEPSGREATIRVVWDGSNAARGGDFLDAALRSGAIRDFDMIDKGGSMAPGKTTWYAVFRLKM